MIYLWLGITVAAAIIEAAVPALVSIWFVPGGLAALLASLLGGAPWLQIILFVAFTTLAAVFTRPLARRLQKDGPTSTNADRVLGAEAVVTQEVNNLGGGGGFSVRGNGGAARSVVPEQTTPAGQVVTVSRIEGVKLIVSPSQKKGETL